MKHYARLLFLVYSTIRKTHYSETLLYCIQLDCTDIGIYALGGR
jgi:hypothetical protein